MDRGDEPKDIKQPMPEIEVKADTDDTARRTFLAKGSGKGGGKGRKSPLREELNSDHGDDHSNSSYKDRKNDSLDHSYDPDRDSSAAKKNRRSRKSRGDHLGVSSDAHSSEQPNLEKKSSLEEFEEIENSLQDKTLKEKKKMKGSRGDNADHKTPVKGTDGGSEMYRLNKEKQEFKKQKEELHNEKRALEKQKRELDKLKLEFEKWRDVENKKINAERQKLDKERKAISRQTDKKKEGTTSIL